MIDETLTMIPGPTPVHPRILDALARPTTSHVFPAFVEEFRQALAGFRSLCQSEAGQPFIVAGGGTLAMEIALVNVVAPGEKVLVVSHGYFGDRFGDLAASFGIEADVLKSEWGKAVPPAEVAARLAAGSYAAVTISHVDTSTGTLAPVEAYVELLRGRPELFILDGVCATGGVDERFDEWGVDVLLTGPQKAIGAPPGLALCLFSERAMARRKAPQLRPGLLRRRDALAPGHAGPREVLLDPLRQRDRRARRGAPDAPRRGARRPASPATGGSPAPSGPGSTRSAWRSSPRPTAAPTRSPSSCSPRASPTRRSARRWPRGASSSPEASARLPGRRSASATWGTSAPPRSSTALGAIEGSPRRPRPPRDPGRPSPPPPRTSDRPLAPTPDLRP